MKLNPRLIGLLTLPPFLWAGNAVVGRMTVPFVPPLMLNAVRWAIVLLVLVVMSRRFILDASARGQIAARWPHLALIGLLGIGAYNALQYLALTTSTPLNVTLIAASMPLWMLSVGALFFGERPRTAQMAGAALSLLGVATVLTRGHLSAIAQVQFVQGDLFMLLAAASWAGYSWLLARPPASMRDTGRPLVHEPDGRSRPWNWHEFMLAQALFGVVWAGTAAGVEAAVSDRVLVLNGWVVLAVVYIVIGPSIIAYWFWGRAVAQAGPTLASLFVNLTPLFAALLSGALLGDRPQGYHALAFALIVAGILVSSRR
ncbi:drug/metabolite transporter (DMT)-like permease [Sphaerotilus hippei]|uniref:Drug/metabolite transporter (DMT)-like permease n=1 Tax=Sphaerotilus hippei TaxID=744406 RepID=A0A318H0I6_9BURK|nr:DMT family transporter [Sphaerotilus hippei]PXW96241.1 drug/metabolite transporter (DMT)-like permease [Sphaerotilus hippei]